MRELTKIETNITQAHKKLALIVQQIERSQEQIKTLKAANAELVEQNIGGKQPKELEENRQEVLRLQLEVEELQEAQPRVERNLAELERELRFTKLQAKGQSYSEEKKLCLETAEKLRLALEQFSRVGVKPLRTLRSILSDPEIRTEVDLEAFLQGEIKPVSDTGNGPFVGKQVDAYKQFTALVPYTARCLEEILLDVERVLGYFVKRYGKRQDRCLLCGRDKRTGALLQKPETGLSPVVLDRIRKENEAREKQRVMATGEELRQKRRRQALGATS